MELEEKITPFFWVEQRAGASVCLNIGSYLQDIFDTRAEEGFEGGGYDWESLARVFLAEIRLDLIEKVNFDSEAGMFVAYSKDKQALEDFILTFKETCDNREKILDLFSRAELD